MGEPYEWSTGYIFNLTNEGKAIQLDLAARTNRHQTPLLVCVYHHTLCVLPLLLFLLHLAADLLAEVCLFTEMSGSSVDVGL